MAELIFSPNIRQAMARALYARQEVVIMDDAFSALDGHTEKNVIERLAGPNGILRTSKLTVVIATSKGESLVMPDFP